MATPTVTARLVPTPVARDLGDPTGNATPGATADLAAVVAGVAGVDGVEVVGGSVDGGTTPGDGVVHLLITVEGEATVGAAQTIIDNVLALDTGDVYDDGGSDLVLTYAPGAEDRIEQDPALNDPDGVTLDISDANVEDIEYVVTLSQGAKLVSIDLTSTDLDGVDVPYHVRHGDPQGHQSQKRQDNTFVVEVGPAPADSEVGSPHDLVVTVTDSNGREGADTVAVTVQV
jgi:hypothetical protein